MAPTREDRYYPGMIRRIEALRYRSLRYIVQDLGPFGILVGPNASGKSTLLDVLQFLSDALLARDGISEAITLRSPDLRDLLWMRAGESFELAVELDVPEERRKRARKVSWKDSGTARYEVALGFDEDGEIAILGETLILKGSTENGGAAGDRQLTLFPRPREPVESLQQLPDGRKSPPGWRRVVSKKPRSGNDYFISESTDWNNPFRLGPQRLALANLPEDEERFPVSTWVKRSLMEGVQSVFLDSEAMRRPSPPGSSRSFLPDGSNLPWVIRQLKTADRQRFDRWVRHVRTALPDVRDIAVTERPEDRHLYLHLEYETGLVAPSWVVSDGTLRLLALTLMAYVGEEAQTYLIEEPENGIHPQAVESVYQSLSSVYTSQVLCASHSPVFLSLARPEDLVCLARDQSGATDIVSGDEHPELRNWRSKTDLGTLFAAGIL